MNGTPTSVRTSLTSAPALTSARAVERAPLTQPRRLGVCVTILLILGGAVQPIPLRATARGYDWLQFDGNAQHSGTNGRETTVTTRNVGRLRLLFRVTLPSVVDGAPVYVRAVPTRHGLR